MKRTFLIISFLFIVNSFVTAQTWYVSGAGSDNSDGKTMATAFRSLQKAADLVEPGNMVLIGDGIYTNDDRSNGSAVLSIRKSGSKDAWITWKAMKGQHPEIHPSGWAGIQITGSYHIIDGLIVIGGNDSIVLLKAQEDTKKPAADPRFNTNGIFVNGRPKAPNEKPHHIIVRNCTVGKCPGGGLIAIEADYFTAEDNYIFENAWFMRYGGSGISTLQNWAYDDAPGYHTIIQRNFVWNNKTMVAWEKIGRLSDGNGIILDVTDQEQEGATNPDNAAVVKPSAEAQAAAAKPKRPEWKGRALVANNICAFNGGSGIHTFRTKYVDIINNTVYHNGAMVGYPDLFANSSEDVVFVNNIIVPRPGGKVTSASNKNVNIRWDYNQCSISQQVYTAPHDIIADPLFVNPYFDRLTADFRLKPGSPAIGSGTDKFETLFISTIIGNTDKGKGKGVNRGSLIF